MNIFYTMGNLCLTFCSAPCTQATAKVTKVVSAYDPMALQPGAYPGFCSMKLRGIFLLLPGWDATPTQGYPPL